MVILVELLYEVGLVVLKVVVVGMVMCEFRLILVLMVVVVVVGIEEVLICRCIGLLLVMLVV